MAERYKASLGDGGEWYVWRVLLLRSGGGDQGRMLLDYVLGDVEVRGYTCTHRLILHRLRA